MQSQHALERRHWLQAAGAAVSFGLASLPVIAAPTPDPLAALAAKTFDEALGALGGELTASPRVTLDVPTVADNGAFVPVTVASALPGTLEIVLLVDGNPQPVAARFVIPAGTEPFVATRIRMAASGTVYAAVRTDEGLFAAARKVQVTVGGCA